MSEAKKTVELEGVVRVGDDCNGFYDVTVGGDDVALELGDLFWSGTQVRATLWVEEGKERAEEGELYSSGGEHGYGTYTPGCGPTVEVGDWDVVTQLNGLDGREVALLVEEL